MALIEDGLTDRAPRVVGSQVRDHRIEVDRFAQDVGPEPIDAARVKLEDRAVPEDGLLLTAAKHKPRAPGAPRAARHDTPPSRHAEMAPDNVPAFETQEQVLAHRFYAEQPAPIELLGQLPDTGARVWRLDADFLTDERLQPASYPMETVPFRH
jgi:hypothetical protein